MSGTPPTPPWTEATGSDPGAEGVDDESGHRSGSGHDEQADRIADADGLLVLSDFDGTLADIQPRPDQARIRPEAREALAALAERPRTAVAVVSGRGLADVRERVGLEGIGYAGNHGLEIETPERRFVHPEAAGAASIVAAVCADLRERLADVEGAIVEEKNLSATVHYRQVADEDVDRIREAVRASVEEHAALEGTDGSGDASGGDASGGDASGGDASTRGEEGGRDPSAGALRVEEGKQIVELKPDVDWDKGRAVEWLADVLVPDDESWHPVYVGDDVTDEDAFRALAGTGTTVRVGGADEPTAAAFRVDDPEAVPALFEWFAAVRER